MVSTFGSVITAMVTPFDHEGALDEAGLAALAEHLVDNGNDGLVVNGTTGEAPTTSDTEKLEAVRIVLDAVGDRARVIAGVGTSDTAHSIELAKQAHAAGAHGLLVVTPYYNKPPQAGILAHFQAVADATDLPVMLYDIPGRTGVPIETATLMRLAEHPNIRAVKDAKGDLVASAQVLAGTDLQWFSGEDGLNLPLLALGASGFVSVIGHFVSNTLAQMRQAFVAGDWQTARDLHFSTLPVNEAVFATQAAITVKGALNRLGLPGGNVRSPLVPATPEQVGAVVAALGARR
ncbi:MAG: 4-hydroxy-tetrahydrodipicolinate synthase [Candidatus Nanopelagicales bacterium]|jgi:4-hydroxy-tetrahydrodipicolinate synthase|nr:4-hydroxy-tetrahydrodipicolinate synthase [Candidatus Nanopelagicales bacterium]MCU0297804.1 4-hydroxy-tetrahydrodipicolinate synthase [Candidatus Nanopelagicales bacterium]